MATHSGAKRGLATFKVPRQRPLVVLFSLFFILSLQNISALDWPTWRHDANRSAVTAQELPPELHLQWVRHLPAPKPAWPKNPETWEKLQFDASYDPVVLETTLFVPSMINDRVTAYDTETGAEKWRFYTGGPVRFAPLGWKDRVYFVSDDGHLCCVGAEKGNLIWRFRGGPSAKTVLGNNRLVSMWPARGAPVIYEDQVAGSVQARIYFAAGIWPFMGIFLHALDAETGEAIWTNSGSGSYYCMQPHHSPAFGGVAPQGYLSATKDKLLVAGGRSVPACYERATGKFLYFNYHGSSGGYGPMIRGNRFICGRIRDIRTVFRLDDGQPLVFMRLHTDPVITEKEVIGVHAWYDNTLVCYSLDAEVKEGLEGRARHQVSSGKADVLWRARLEEEHLEELFIMAGGRLYGSTKSGEVVAIELASSGEEKTANVSWRADIKEVPWNMLAADDKLFVVSHQGSIFCFGGKKKPATTHDYAGKDFKQVKSRRYAPVLNVLDDRKLKDGYCIVAGIDDGNLIKTVLQSSDLYVIGIDQDKKTIRELRRFFDERGLYGHRVSLHVGDPLSFEFPPYLANVILSESMSASEVSALGAAGIRQFYRTLRPYGGMLCLSAHGNEADRFAGLAEDLGLRGLKTEELDRFVLVTRSGPLPGSADWTHQYADSANTTVSMDELVKLPLGVLWFGNPTNEKVLPRHGHGPSPQVAGGRLFIEGPNTLSARDVYTGRVLWEKDLPGLGKFFDNTSHEPGANAVGSNYISLPDRIYVVYERGILGLDPETGKTVAEFHLPHEPDEQSPKIGYIGVMGNILLAGSSPMDYPSDYEFGMPRCRTYRYLTEERIERVAERMQSLKGYRMSPRAEDEQGKDFIIRNLNCLLYDKNLVVRLTEKLTDNIRTNIMENAAEGKRDRQLEADLKEAGEIRKKTAQYLESRKHGVIDGLLLQLNRRLLELYFGLPRENIGIGLQRSWSGTASKRLVAMDRPSGKVLWTRDAVAAFVHNGIAMGSGRVYCLDRFPHGKMLSLKRRGIENKTAFSVLALDAETGKVEWTDSSVVGTWLGYSEKHDVLVQSARHSSDMLPEPEGGVIAYQGKTGKILWRDKRAHSGPCMIHDGTAIMQSVALDLLSGDWRYRKNPISGNRTLWRCYRAYGCNSMVGAVNLLTFRSAAAGYFDLTNNGGTGNWGGFKSGCTANLIAANGVLNAPDYTRTCSCSYQNQTSLALTHMPEVEVWTWNKKLEGGLIPVRRVGINFGAPGDRRADNGTLWLDYPSVGGPSPEIETRTDPESPEFIRYHSSAVGSGELKWVAASAAKGLKKISLTLGNETPVAYTVRLVFAELEDVGPGQRRFDVMLQGARVLSSFDICEAAGGRNATVIKEFKDIEVTGKITVELQPVAGSAEADPLAAILREKGW